MSHFFDSCGNRVSLGKKIGAGGEAVAYEVLGVPSKVVKIYHELADQRKTEKLAAMVSLSKPSIAKFSAWPIALLIDQKSKRAAGVVMERVGGVEIHSLYTPANRKQSFPSADWGFLVRTAHNYAAAINSLHAAGIVIGDVNQGNSLVENNAIVRFIDCDSYQIRSGNQLFRCEVGVPHFTPPELQTCRFSEVDRTVNHDCFGLAVMIFHLLFAGRHPFAGRYSGTGELTIEQAIEGYRFAYGANRGLYQIDPPPNTPIPTDSTGEIATLFERAFGREGSRNGGRPSASEWMLALRGFEASLVQCDKDRGHKHVKKGMCPWCRIQQGGGPNFFISVSTEWFRSRLKGFDRDKVLKRIRETSSHLAKLLDLPPPSSTGCRPTLLAISSEGFGHSRNILWYGAMASALLTVFGFYWWVMWLISIPGFIVFILQFFLFNYFSPIEVERRARREEFDDQSRKLMKYDSDALESIRSVEADAKAIKYLAEEIDSRLKAIEREKENELSQINSNLRDRQLDDYLRGEFICRQPFMGIGPSRLAMLESYGVETAYDIDYITISQIPGFGEVLTSRLLAWKERVKSKFVFQPHKGIPSAYISSIEFNYSQRKLNLQMQLSDLPRKLDQCIANGIEKVNSINLRRVALHKECCQALADFEFIENLVKSGRS